jgi:vacuolar-type H+-ATPase subunit I/STV1
MSFFFSCEIWRKNEIPQILRYVAFLRRFFFFRLAERKKNKEKKKTKNKKNRKKKYYCQYNVNNLTDDFKDEIPAIIIQNK